MRPFINILLRTHDRPISFKRMLNSIRTQTYTNYRIIISVDNERTENYVLENGITDFIRIERDPSLPYPADFYFNTLIAEVKKGFIWGVDDDDFLPHEQVLETIAQNLRSDMINIFRMKSTTTIMPLQHKIEVCHIGTPCFIVPIEIAMKASWKGESGSDYTYIKELSNIMGMDKINWVDEVIYQIDKPNQRGKGEI